MSQSKLYTRESLERALIHHHVDYSPPVAPSTRGWRIGHGVAAVSDLSSRDVYFYVLGLADKERQMLMRDGPVEGAVRDGDPTPITEEEAEQRQHLISYHGWGLDDLESSLELGFTLDKMHTDHHEDWDTDGPLDAAIAHHHDGDKVVIDRRQEHDRQARA